DITMVAKNTPGAGIKDYEAQIDMVALRAFRLKRLQAELRRLDLGGAVLYDPINVRYATGSRQMAVWSLHNACRYAFVPAEGKPVLFEFDAVGALQAARALESIGEVRPAIMWFYFVAGGKADERAVQWADEIADLVKERCGGNHRIAFDHLDYKGVALLQDRGITVTDAQMPVERARAVKGPEEIACMNVCISVCETGMARMHEALKPGLTENALWSILHQTNIEMGGEWIETRLLASGGRTNPWFQECGERMIRPGDLIAFDTDLIGPFGYCADISRTFHCGPGKPSEEQKTLYKLSVEQIEHNMALLKPGMSFRELVEKSWRIPNAYAANAYPLYHGVGMADEWPAIVHRGEMDKLTDPDDVMLENMTICVESYIGADSGAEGVKMEQQVLITENGYQLLSTYPYDEALLS
ncbi:MAG: Xaa-Pro peptidase family protein, partial [Alphaproteobacteria bacterium]